MALCVLRSDEKSFLCLVSPPPPTLHFVLLFAVYMMQLRAMAALLRASLNHQQKKNVRSDGGDE